MTPFWWASFFAPVCGSRNSIRLKSGAVFVFWSESVNGGFAIETRTAPTYPPASLEAKYWPRALLRISGAQYVRAVGTGGVSSDNLGEGRRNHERRLFSNPRHLHHRRCCHRRCSAASDEFFKVGPNRTGVPILAQAYHRYLGGLEWIGLHHGVYHALLPGRPVDGVKNYGNSGWNCRMDRRADHVWP